MKSLFDFQPQQDLKDTDFDYINQTEKLKTVLQKLQNSNIIYLDTEVIVKNPEKVNPFDDQLRLIQVGDEKHLFVIDLFKVDKDLLKETLSPLLTNKGIVGHNLKFDLKFIYTNFKLLPKFCFDTMIASQVISKGKDGYKHSLKALSNRYTGEDIDKHLQKSDWSALNLSSQQLQYAADDIKVLRGLYKALLEKVNENIQGTPSGSLAKLFGIKDKVVALEMAFLPAVVEMEVAGIPVDTQHLNKLIQETEKHFQTLYYEFKRRFSIEPFSQQQVVSYLVNRLKINLPKTEKGSYSSQDTVLKNYIEHEEVRMLLEIRTTKKLLDKLKETSENTINNRVYGEFKQIGAPTGRMSSAKPNLQNIPSELKHLFKTPEGYSFIIADYSQIELRIAAEYTQDEKMIEAFVKGMDLHRLTASIITGKPYDHISPQERKLAKAINFGLIYGMSPHSLVEYAKSNYEIDLSVEDAKEFHKNFFEYYKSFHNWHNSVKEYLKHHRLIEVKTLFGRKIVASRFTDAVNYPIQGSGSDLLKMAVVFFQREKDNSSRVVNLVHDEIVVESSDENIKKNRDLLVDSMEKAGKLILRKVPVDLEVLLSKTWKKD